MPVCPINAIDDDELDVRLWANIHCGQRGSPVYLGKEDGVLKARTASAAAAVQPDERHHVAAADPRSAKPGH